jgi:hypothetical protein
MYQCISKYNTLIWKEVYLMNFLKYLQQFVLRLPAIYNLQVRNCLDRQKKFKVRIDHLFLHIYQKSLSMS